MKLGYRLLSLNVLCGTFLKPIPLNRFRSQTKKILAIDPDIICLQEFNNPYVEYVYKQNLQKYYNFYTERISFTEVLRRCGVISFYGILFSQIHLIILIGYLISLFYPYFFNFIIGNQKTGNAILWKKDIKLINFKTIEFNNQQGDFLNLMRHRGYIEFKIDDITIINTHLDHMGTNRNNQINELLHEKRNKNLIVGDMNTEDINIFIDNKYINCTKKLGFTYRTDNPLTKTLFVNLKKSKCIDYIFSKGVPILKTSKLDCDSDHDALLCEFNSVGDF
jgi:endonuclease/exonuclease/phosphatase family metal-dependent hydrolase